MQNPDIIQDQIAYYRARANEYDEWFYRQGRFDHGEEFNNKWFAQVAEVARALDAFAPAGDVLELACGTGLWTERLIRHATTLTALDAAPEVLAINKERVKDVSKMGAARSDAAPSIRYLQTDLFAWEPDQRYDVVYFSFWLSHVPPERFTPFWDLVHRCLKPDGRAFFIDSLYEPTTTANNHQLLGKDSTIQDRELNDGRAYRIVKVYHEPESLAAQLADLGWNTAIDRTEDYFIYGNTQFEA
ncbi:MAG: class I SAM-dependent methyltransferase [Candidatus Latescibacterota bacterium]|nr:class I SAM-dependent methyltransferase [Candidatus Latescibacterota bacterium]